MRKIAAVVVVLVLLGVPLYLFFAPGKKTVQKRPAKQEVTTERGTITVGGLAFMDGRDTEAKPPLTVMSINVWDSHERSRGVCSIPHGSRVNVLASQWSQKEDRFYFKISGLKGCSGWVPESFLSPTHSEPIGDRV